jgi:hypothetical protein
MISLPFSNFILPSKNVSRQCATNFGYAKIEGPVVPYSFSTVLVLEFKLEKP